MKFFIGSDDETVVPQVTLNVEQFQQLCEALNMPPPKTGERRGLARVEFRSAVTVAMVEKGDVLDSIQSTLRDISPGGATLNHPHPLKPGSHMVLFVESIRLVAKVVHCKCFADGTAMVGLEFQGILDSQTRKAN